MSLSIVDQLLNLAVRELTGSLTASIDKMDYSIKIKALQHKAGVEEDGIANIKTWVGIYCLVFASLPNLNSVYAIIKAVQQKISIKVTGKAGARTWDALYDLLIGKKMSLTYQNLEIDPHNEVVLKNMAKEVVPFAKELISLAANQGINIRIMISQGSHEQTSGKPEYTADHTANFFYSNFGLVFDVAIVEQRKNGKIMVKDDSQLYAKVARLGESIGLTWGGSKRSFTSLPHFELRPAWGLRMNEFEMIKELNRRKDANINLLAIL